MSNKSACLGCGNLIESNPVNLSQWYCPGCGLYRWVDCYGVTYYRYNNEGYVNLHMSSTGTLSVFDNIEVNCKIFPDFGKVCAICV
jgi:predicted RNA-binding Zn-ribbon protein involved in translation (DUF1610 family)